VARAPTAQSCSAWPSRARQFPTSTVQGIGRAAFGLLSRFVVLAHHTPDPRIASQHRHDHVCEPANPAGYLRSKPAQARSANQPPIVQAKMKPCTDSFGLGRASKSTLHCSDRHRLRAHLMLSNLSVGEPHQSELLMIVSLQKHSVGPGLSYSTGWDSAQGADMQGPNGLSD
jgi:hypothetical protein